MFINHNRVHVLNALRVHGPMNPVMIAEFTGLSPYVVRDELQAMRKDRLINMNWGDRAIVWELTPKGYDVEEQAYQLNMGLTS
jgi:hypothetical protein